MNNTQKLISRALKYLEFPDGEIKFIGNSQKSIIHGENNFNAGIRLLKDALGEKPVIKIAGTKEQLGADFPKELRCSNECDGGDVCVDTETGICSVCGLEHIIEETEVIVEG